VLQPLHANASGISDANYAVCAVGAMCRDADGKAHSYDEHEDSVYGLAWSAADPWLFASMSYDGRLVVNKVPKNIKYKILI
jgi:WD40 repeat protein